MLLRGYIVTAQLLLLIIRGLQNNKTSKKTDITFLDIELG